MKQETNVNLHNTSYSVTSKPEELVPSRYALKIGEIDVLVVSDGVLPLPTVMPPRRTGQPGCMTCSCRRTRSTGR